MKNWKLKIAFALSLALSSVPVHVHADDVGFLTQPQEQPEPPLKLADELRPFIKTLDQPIYIFHYVDHSRVGQDVLQPINMDDPKVTNHLQEWSAYFHNTARGWQNGGTYAANNPFASRSYGHLLYRIEVPAGTRYVDFSEENNKPLPPELIKRLNRDYKCNLSEYKYFVWGGAGSPECLSKVSEALKELKVGLTAYPWETRANSDCHKTPNTTFIITDASIFPKDNVVIHNEKNPPKSEEEKKERIMLTRLYSDHNTVHLFPVLIPDAQKLTAQEVKDWKGSHLLGCENLRPTPKPEPTGGTCSAPASGDPLGGIKPCIDAASEAAKKVQ